MTNADPRTATPPRTASGPPPVIVDRGPLSPAFTLPDGVSLTALQLQQLARLRDLLLGWNERINLTAIREPAAVEQWLLLDALIMVPELRRLLPEQPQAALIDIGTGAGFPGLPLAIAMPELDCTLLDATGKKVRFIATVVAELGLGNVQPLHGRAEELGHDERFRARFDLATARAVATLPTLLELAAPLLRVGGKALFPKSTSIEEELVDGERAAQLLGVRIAGTKCLPSGSAGQVTQLVRVDKLALTPMRFPRRVGLPAKEPLGKASS